MPPKKKVWNAPKTKKERVALYNKCGPSAFLAPSTLGFPIVPKNTRTCKPTRIGEIAALKRANEFHHFDIAAKARGHLIRDQL